MKLKLRTRKLERVLIHGTVRKAARLEKKSGGAFSEKLSRCSLTRYTIIVSFFTSLPSIPTEILFQKAKLTALFGGSPPTVENRSTEATQGSTHEDQCSIEAGPSSTQATRGSTVSGPSSTQATRGSTVSGPSSTQATRGSANEDEAQQIRDKVQLYQNFLFYYHIVVFFSPVTYLPFLQMLNGIASRGRTSVLFVMTRT